MKNEKAIMDMAYYASLLRLGAQQFEGDDKATQDMKKAMETGSNVLFEISTSALMTDFDELVEKIVSEYK